MDYSPGLRGVIAGETEISTVGMEGTSLRYRGYDAIELTKTNTYEDVASLIIDDNLDGKLFRQSFSEHYKQLLEDIELVTLVNRLKLNQHPMDVIRTAISYIGEADESNKLDAASKVAAIACLTIASYNQESSDKLDEDYLQNVISDLLSNNGFNECMNNSLSKSSYSELITEIKLDEQVKLINPLSQDLDGMRQSLLFSGLESIAFNLNRKNHNLSFYEFGKTYQIINSKYIEKKKLILLSCGNEKSESWNEQNKKKDFFWIKQKVEHILKRLGLHNLKGKNNELSYLVDAYSFNFKKNKIADFGFVNKATLKPFGIKTDVLYAELDWDLIVKHIHSKTKYSEVNKFPSVRRDLALLLDKDVEFSKLNSLAKQTETNLLKSVNLFDVYEGDKLPENKKSYALSFILEDKENTLTDSQIDGVMDKLINAFEQKVGAEVRK